MIWSIKIISIKKIDKNNWNKRDYVYDNFIKGTDGKTKRQYNVAFALKILENTYGFNIKTYSRGQKINNTLDKKSLDLDWLKKLCYKYCIKKPFSINQLESGKCYIKDLEEGYISSNGSFPDAVEKIWGK